MTSDIEPTIRRAGPEDCEAVSALVRAFHAEDGHPISERGLAAVRAMLAPGSPHGSIMLLNIGPQAAGYGALCLGFSIEYEGREAFIDDLYVVPSWRGRGLGRLLFAALEQEARACGCSVIHLEVMPGNTVQRWYQALGYVDRRSALLTKRM